MKNEAGEFIDNYPMPGDVVEILPAFAETHILYIKSMEIAVNKALEQVGKEAKENPDGYTSTIRFTCLDKIINSLKL